MSDLSNSFSIPYDLDQTGISKTFQTTIKQLLQTRVFLANYKEKKYVNLLNEYRDVIVISNSEKDLKETLDICFRRIRQECTCSDKYWIGISGPGPDYGTNATINHCLWVEMSNRPFGYYWFQIKTVKFRGKEVLCKLKCIRNMSSEETQESTFTEQKATVEPDWEKYFQELKKSTNKNLHHFVTESLTLENITQALKFIIIFLFTLFNGSLSALQYLGEFSLKLLHELSHFVQVSTPVMLGIIDFIAKVIGGFYILIAMMWKGDKKATAPPPRVIPYQNYQRQIKYR